MLYNIVLLSAVYQHEAATGIHTSPPSQTSLPPPTPTPSHSSRLTQSTGMFSLTIMQLHSKSSGWGFRGRMPAFIHNY